MYHRQHFDDEDRVQLYADTQDRRKWDTLSEFYAIIVTTEHLENARIKSAVGRDEYVRECSALINQFKDAEMALKNNGGFDTEKFFEEYELNCPYAKDRLITQMNPATVYRDVDERDQISRARQAAETTQCFITVMDALKLEQRAVDEIYPLINDLWGRLTKVDGLPPEFEGLRKTRKWLSTLDEMKASDELSDEQARQLLHELDTSYSDFFRYLETTANDT